MEKNGHAGCRKAHINMSASLVQSAPVSGKPDDVPTPDQKRFWFALVLPCVMAFLLALVPVIGKGAAGPFALVLLPLVLWSAFRDTERAIYVYLAWCWMDGTIRGVFGGGPVLIVARDIVLGIVVVGWGAQRLQNRASNPLRWPPGSLLIALFAIICLLQFFNPYSLGLVQSIGGLKLHLSPIPLFFVAYDTIRRPAQVRALFVFLTLATLVIGLVSFVQYTQGEAWTWAHFPGTKEAISQDTHVMHAGAKVGAAGLFKPPGTTAFGGGVGAYVGMVFPLTFGLVMLSSGRFASWVLKAGLLGVLMAYVVMMLTNGLRSALVGAVAAVLISGVLIGGRLRARMLAGAAVCLVLGVIALTYSQSVSQGAVTDRFASTFSDPADAMHKDRRTFFDDVAGIAVNSPMGVGMGRMLAGSGRLGTAAHDLDFVVYSESYLGEMMFETGLVGAALITCIAVSFLLRGGIALMRLHDADSKLLAAALLGMLGVVFAEFFAAPVLMGPPGSVLFWLSAGVLLRTFTSKARPL